NYWRRAQQGMVRAKLVGKIFFNHFLEASAKAYYGTFAKHKATRYRRQVCNLMYLVTWKDQGPIQWSKKCNIRSV
ncbi:PIPO, partial [Peanut mottle virus]